MACLSVLIRLLLPTFGKRTMPTETQCDALGLYALRRWSNAWGMRSTGQSNNIAREDDIVHLFGKEAGK
jgi:hypothetical protein